MNKIHKPIFIIGSSRSGTTLLYNLLAVHPDVCWFSTITDLFPHAPQLAILHRILDMPFLGAMYKKAIMSATKGNHLMISPREGADIYDLVCGFTNARKTTELDRTDQMESRLKNAITTHLVVTRKIRFLNKKPENIQRIRLLNALFPDAYFIHVIRDGRAVANSLLKAYWWPDAELWWKQGSRPKDLIARGEDPLHIAALHWSYNVKEMQKNRQLLKGRYIEIRYEDFVVDIRATITRLLQKLELMPHTEYLSLLPSSTQNMNYKWQVELSPRERVMLNEILSPLLKKLRYIKR